MLVADFWRRRGLSGTSPSSWSIARGTWFGGLGRWCGRRRSRKTCRSFCLSEQIRGNHTMSLSSAEVMKLLGLHPHPTCGFTNEVYRSALTVPAADLPDGYDGPRTLGGFLYFL